MLRRFDKEIEDKQIKNKTSFKKHLMSLHSNIIFLKNLENQWKYKRNGLRI